MSVAAICQLRLFTICVQSESDPAGNLKSMYTPASHITQLPKGGRRSSPVCLLAYGLQPRSIFLFYAISPKLSFTVIIRNAFVIL